MNTLALIFALTSIALAKIDVRTAPEGSGLPQLAAREVTRYLYLRTGVLPEQIAQDGAIVIAKGFDAGDG